MNAYNSTVFENMFTYTCKANLTWEQVPILHFCPLWCCLCNTKRKILVSPSQSQKIFLSPIFWKENLKLTRNIQFCNVFMTSTELDCRFSDLLHCHSTNYLYYHIVSYLTKWMKQNLLILAHSNFYLQVHTLSWKNYSCKLENTNS